MTRLTFFDDKVVFKGVNMGNNNCRHGMCLVLLVLLFSNHLPGQSPADARIISEYSQAGLEEMRVLDPLKYKMQVFVYESSYLIEEGGELRKPVLAEVMALDMSLLTANRKPDARVRIPLESGKFMVLLSDNESLTAFLELLTPAERLQYEKQFNPAHQDAVSVAKEEVE